MEGAVDIPKRSDRIGLHTEVLLCLLWIPSPVLAVGQFSSLFFWDLFECDALAGKAEHLTKTNISECQSQP